MFDSERRNNLEERRVRIPVCDEIANSCQATGDRLIRDHLAVHTNAFPERDEVRGGEQAGAISSSATDRVNHGADGAFAICASDVNDLTRNYNPRGAFARLQFASL